MSIVFTSPFCARRGCPRPAYRERLCGQCWRLARLFGKDLEMFAYEPLDGYRDHRDAVALPWEHWERDAAAVGLGVADLLARAPSPNRSES